MEPKLKNFGLSLAMASTVALVGGCATARPTSLDRARTSLLQVQQNPEVVTYAPGQLREAQMMMAEADHEWDRSGNAAEVSHLSYLTEQEAGIALAVARQKAAEAEAERLREERDRVRLSARTYEAELARERAEQARLDAQSASARALLLEQQLAVLQARDTERGLVMTLQEGVLFEYDRAELKPGAMRNLSPLIAFLKDYPIRTLLIEGYTDNIGSDSYNLDLSQRRAMAVRDFLVMNGISADRIIARGYGESYPVTSNTNEAGRQQNRRVEIVISHEGQHLAER